MYEINEVKTDKKKEAEGVWIDIGNGGRLKIARNGNPNTQRKWEKIRADPAIRNSLRHDTISLEKMDDLILDVLSETVLLDWEGMSENGEPMKFSVEKAREVLRNVTVIREIVQNYASDYTFFRASVLDESAEALKKS